MEALSHHVVFSLDVEVEWHLIALILISTYVLIFLYYTAQSMPNFSNNYICYNPK
jgi:hypothetical protein